MSVATLAMRMNITATCLRLKMAGTKQNKQKCLIFIAVHQFEEKKINSVDFTKLKGEGCGFSYL